MIWEVGAYLQMKVKSHQDTDNIVYQQEEYTLRKWVPNINVFDPNDPDKEERAFQERVKRIVERNKLNNEAGNNR